MPITPERLTGSAFAATRYVTFPSPWPLAEVVSDIHDACDDALHVQSRSTMIETVPTPPAESKEAGDVDAAVSHRPDAAGEGAATLGRRGAAAGDAQREDRCRGQRDNELEECVCRSRRTEHDKPVNQTAPAAMQESRQPCAGDVWYNKATPAEQF